MARPTVATVLARRPNNRERPRSMAVGPISAYVSRLFADCGFASGKRTSFDPWETRPSAKLTSLNRVVAVDSSIRFRLSGVVHLVRKERPRRNSLTNSITVARAVGQNVDVHVFGVRRIGPWTENGCEPAACRRT